MTVDQFNTDEMIQIMDTYRQAFGRKMILSQGAGGDYYVIMLHGGFSAERRTFRDYESLVEFLESRRAM